MRFGVLTLPNVPLDELERRWRTLDELGVETIWLADQLQSELSPAKPWFEAWTCLGAVARCTERARVGPLVSPLLLRNPAVLAKAAVTLDHLTGGRAELGVGAGGSPLDAELAGVEPVGSDGGADRLVPFVEALVAHLDGDRLQPRPVQQRVPLTIGAHSPAALRLAARHADRWSSYGGVGLEPETALERARARNARLDELCAEEGRDPRTLTRSLLLGHRYVGETPWRSEDAFLDVVRRWGEAGMDELVLYYPATVQMPAGTVEDGLFERVFRDLVPGLRHARRGSPARVGE